MACAATSGAGVKQKGRPRKSAAEGSFSSVTGLMIGSPPTKLTVAGRISAAQAKTGVLRFAVSRMTHPVFKSWAIAARVLSIADIGIAKTMKSATSQALIRFHCTLSTAPNFCAFLAAERSLSCPIISQSNSFAFKARPIEVPISPVPIMAIRGLPIWILLPIYQRIFGQCAQIGIKFIQRIHIQCRALQIL